ncbi:MAG TPA: response regulator [Bacillota bacterium]|nr:response regulator [Bacillota bacterium]
MARIMVVDDEPKIVMVLQEILEEHGHEVMIAANGDTGWELMLQTGKLDLLLVDLNMPGMTGSQFILKMRTETGFRDIPVILITGSIPDDRTFPPAGSYQDYISKPFDIDDVIAKVERLLVK